MSNNDYRITKETFVGRKEELRKIQEAIKAPGLQIVSIQGEGGIGKTSLLSKVMKDYKERRGFYVTGILDFFSTATHTPDGFLGVLIEEFPPEAFKSYRAEREKYDIVRLAGMPGQIVEEHREKADKAFRDDFRSLTESREAVLLIDTFEVVQDTMGPWLLDLLERLTAEARDTRGATFIIAGRHNKEWQETLTSRFPGQVTYFELGPLKEKETKELFDEFVAGIPEDERRKLELLTGRHPLLIALTLDWRGREGVSLDHLTTTTARYTLADLQQMSPDELGKMHPTFEAELVEKFQELKPTDRVILLMAHVYKRLDAAILAYLMDNTTKEQAEELLEEMKWWCFMKHDPRTNTYQLHDKMRDMVLEHMWPKADPERSLRPDLSSQMVKYYELWLEERDREIEQKIDERKKAEARGDKTAEAAAKRVEVELRNEKRVFAAHFVYYDILAEPDEGSLRCGEAITDDIWASDVNGYILKQREREDALKVLGRTLPEYVTDLEKARVLTVIERKREEALDLLERLDDPLVFSLTELAKSTHQADVKVYQSLIICYGLPPLAEVPPDAQELRELVQKWVGEGSPYERAVDLAQKAIDILKGQEKLDLTDLERRAVRRSLARAYHTQAYPLTRMGRLMESIKATQLCVSYARLGGLPVGQSIALNDQGFIRALLGQFIQARQLVVQGLEIRESLGLDYLIGFSLNTMGLINFMEDKSHEGRIHCEQALHIFNRLGEKRGLGMAHITLGRITRRIGEMERKEELLKESEKHLKEAEEIFAPDKSGRLIEPARLYETYEQLGILYLVWGGSFLPQIGGEQSTIAKLLKKAEPYFDKAVKGYEGGGNKREQAIALERWARVYSDLGDLLRAEEKLRQAEKSALAEAPGIEFEPPGEGESREEIEIPQLHPEYLLVLGKVERQRGHIASDRFRNTRSEDHLREAARHFTLACTYLEKFSEEARELKDALEMVGDLTRLLDHKEIGYFINSVRETQEKYGLQKYERLPAFIKALAGIE
jgi:tetratricopeptide (TPR) repeat protein